MRGVNAGDMGGGVGVGGIGDESKSSINFLRPLFGVVLRLDSCSLSDILPRSRSRSRSFSKAKAMILSFCRSLSSLTLGGETRLFWVDLPSLDRLLTPTEFLGETPGLPIEFLGDKSTGLPILSLEIPPLISVGGAFPNVEVLNELALRLPEESGRSLNPSSSSFGSRTPIPSPPTACW